MAKVGGMADAAMLRQDNGHLEHNAPDVLIQCRRAVLDVGRVAGGSAGTGTSMGGTV
jgi:hypothetical protein